MSRSPTASASTTRSITRRSATWSSWAPDPRGSRRPCTARRKDSMCWCRRPSLENLSQFEGAGVYYCATFVEAQVCRGDDVVVVGGGNSAGQAAVFLAQTAKRVHMLVRSNGLAESMSRYLIRRIEQSPAI